MIFTLNQRRNAYKRLPEDIKILIMSNETTEIIENILKEAQLTEEQANLADSELLDVMFCLQSLDNAINNIAKLSNKTVNELSKLKSVVNDKILSKYTIDIKDFIEANKTTPIQHQSAAPKNLPGEANLPELAPEIHPMIEKGEVAHDVPPQIEQKKMKSLSEPVIILKKEDVRQMISPKVQPNSAPTPTPAKPNVSLPDYRYEGGTDPYREPLK
jgi:hypothetical protein